MKNINGQVWIESVIYILIGLALIGLVLAFVSPRINMEKDHVVIEQTIESLNILDKKIGEMLELLNLVFIGVKSILILFLMKLYL
jgi:hypothetical protein